MSPDGRNLEIVLFSFSRSLSSAKRQLIARRTIAPLDALKENFIQKRSSPLIIVDSQSSGLGQVVNPLLETASLSSTNCGRVTKLVPSKYSASKVCLVLSLSVCVS